MPYNDPYSPIQTGAAIMSGAMRSYNNNLARQADLARFKYQIKRQDAMDTRATQRFDMQMEDRTRNIARQGVLDQRADVKFNAWQVENDASLQTGMRNAYAAGDYAKADTLYQGMSTTPSRMMQGALKVGGMFMGDAQPTRQAPQTAIPQATTPSAIAPQQQAQPGGSAAQPRITSIGGTKPLRDDAGYELGQKGGELFRVKEAKDKYGTTTKKLGGPAVTIERESSFAETKKQDPDKLRAVLEGDSSGLKKMLSNTLLGTGQKLYNLENMIAELTQTSGMSGGDPEYEYAVRHDKALLGVGEDKSRQVLDVVVDAVLGADMEEEERTEVFDSLASTGLVSMDRVIELSVPKEMGNAWNTLRDVLSRRFSADERAGEVTRGVKAMRDNLVKHGFVTESGQPNRERIRQEINDQIRKHPEDYEEIYKTTLSETGSPAKAGEIVNSKALQTYLEMKAEAAVSEIIGTNFGKGRMHRAADVVASPVKAVIKHDIKLQKAGRKSLPGTWGFGNLR
jgi:hypothetical protein